MGLAQSMGYQPNISAEKRQKQYILMTYRSGIKSLDKATYYTSDSGWGCMLRVGQMFVANLLYFKVHLGQKQKVVQLFYDNLMVPFSIQNMTKISKEFFPHMKPYQWYTPCQVGFLIKEMLEKFDQLFKVKICNDGSMFLEDIITDSKQLEQLETIIAQKQQKPDIPSKQPHVIGWKLDKQEDIPFKGQRIVIFLMARIGLDHPEPGYLKCISKFIKNKFFMGILGGTPKYAHLFLEYQDGYFGYLDPHTTQPVVNNYAQIPEHLNEYSSKLTWLRQGKIDTSMAVSFMLKKTEVQEFWLSMKSLKEELKEDFFVYIDIRKPEIDQNAIIQIEFSDQQEEQTKNT